MMWLFKIDYSVDKILIQRKMKLWNVEAHVKGEIMMSTDPEIDNETESADY